MAFENFPYTDFHNLNIDWVLKTVKKLNIDWSKYYTDWNAWKEEVTNYINNFDMDKSVADYLNNLLESGELDVIIGKWLSNTLTGITNAISYGFKNDGSDNSDTFTKFIDDGLASTVLYFPPGTFCFSKALAFPDEMHVLMHPKSIIKCIGSDVACFITLRDGSTASDYATDSYIRGGTVDGNLACKYLLGVHKSQNPHFCENMRFINIKAGGGGIRTSLSSTVDGENGYNNILIDNPFGVHDNAPYDTYGIADSGLDNVFNNIEIINCTTGIYTINGTFNNVKMWIRSENQIHGSRGVFCAGYNIRFNNVTVDTYRYAFTADKDGFGASITNCFIIYNGGVYNSDLLATYPPIIFNCEYPGRVFSVCNLMYDSYFNPKFSQSNLTGYSSFINVRAQQGKTIANTNNVVSMERLLVSNEYTLNTNEYGVVVVDNLDLIISAMVTNVSRAVATIAPNVGLVIYQADNDTGALKRLANTAVTIRVLRKNKNYNIYEFN